MTPGEIQVLVPVHNEGESIGGTIREFCAVVRNEQGLPVSLLVLEDGSTDDTRDVVQEVAAELPVRLLSFAERKGYWRAMVDGIAEASAEVIGFIDGDGQCDPADFAELYRRVPGHDVVAGYRNPRSDPLPRRVMSAAFGLVYRALFPNVHVRDPSCPFLLIRRCIAPDVLRGRVGLIDQGFWWEFHARAAAAGVSVAEAPVRHRARAAGITKNFRLAKVPRLAVENLWGLFALWRELHTRLA